LSLPVSSIGIVGTGAWGLALALHGARAGHHITLVARDEATVRVIARERQSRRLPDYRIPDAIEVQDDLPRGADLLLWVVPTQHLRASLLRLKPTSGPIVICAKGVEVGSHLLPLEIVEDVSAVGPLAVLTGPNFANEVACGLPTASVVAATDASVRKLVSTILGTPSLRLYGNDDPIGAQLGGAAKNVIAIAAGVVIGAGLGENARAALVTRALSELRRLAVVLGGRAETIMGLSGLGDLMLTCTGQSSRNFSLGYALGQGERLENVLARRAAVTEGVPTAAALIARAGEVEMPICRVVALMLAGGITVNQAIKELLSRPQRDE
jgi:glycerol-3-phosphate dehydrogenase (NAD(P)+)